MELVESTFVPSEVVDEAMAMLQGQFAAKDPHLEIVVDGAKLRADRQKLRQILFNLLGNARKGHGTTLRLRLPAARAGAGNALTRPRPQARLPAPHPA